MSCSSSFVRSRASVCGPRDRDTSLHQHSWRVLLTLLVGLSVVLGSLGCAKSYADRSDTEVVVTEQPVAYSHAVHIAEGLECKRCHAGALENKRAGLPPLATCVSCHRRTIPDHPEVQKLLTAWENQTPIQWIKVNILPKKSMVQFHHAAHARADVGCEQCHGDVASMAIAEPVIDVARMGWCVQCHRDNGASDDCLACHY